MGIKVGYKNFDNTEKNSIFREMMTKKLENKQFVI